MFVSVRVREGENVHGCVCVCGNPQCAQAPQALQHAVMDVLQTVGGEDQLVDPRGPLKRPLLDVTDTIVTKVTAGGQQTDGWTDRQAKGRERERERENKFKSNPSICSPFT